MGLLILLLAAPSLAQKPNGTKDRKVETKAAAVETKGAATEGAKPIAVDDLFVETYENYIWTQKEIDRLEQATGTVEIPTSIRDLRKRSQEKLAKLNAWMAEHKVPLNWGYDFQARRFVPPPAAAQPPAPSAAGPPSQ